MALRYSRSAAVAVSSSMGRACVRPQPLTPPMAAAAPAFQRLVAPPAGGPCGSVIAPRAFSTRARRRQRGVGPRWANHAQEGGDGPHPRLQDTLRKFYLKVHPDLFTHYPAQKEVNQESFSRFQAFLDDVRDKNTAPPRAAMHSYRFYLKTAEEGRFREVGLELRTTGGDCRNLVQRSLEGFFRDCGLPEKFEWAASDWSYSIEAPPTEEEREELRRREEAGY